MFTEDEREILLKVLELAADKARHTVSDAMLTAVEKIRNLPYQRNQHAASSPEDDNRVVVQPMVRLHAMPLACEAEARRQAERA
jgi:hypothetical protein